MTIFHKNCPFLFQKAEESNKGTKKERECLIEPIGESHRNLHWISLVEIMYTFSYEGMFFFISYIHKSQLLTVYFLSRKLCGIRINCPKISFKFESLVTRWILKKKVRLATRWWGKIIFVKNPPKSNKKIYKN